MRVIKTFSKKTTLVLVMSATALAACSRVEQSSDLNDYLKDTDTSQSERTVQWYQDQDTIRTEVLSLCFNHFKAKLFNSPTQEYLNKFNNDLYSLYTNIPDCKNARMAEIALIPKQNQVAMITDPTQVSNIEAELEKPEVKEHIAVVSTDIAKRLEASRIAREKHKPEVLATLDEYTKEGGKLEQILNETTTQEQQ